MRIAPTGRPPFRADHIGSLLRPATLRHAFKRHAEKTLSDAELRRVQHEAIRDFAKLQESCCLQVVTDGEFRRISYWARSVSLTDGLTVKEAAFRFRDEHGHESDFTAPHVIGKVKRGGDITVDEFRFVKGLTRATPKITMP